MVREIRRNEQHDAFINAVTHELKTPVASIRLYLETLQTRPVDEAKRKEFYRVMLDDSDRLLSTIEQVLRTGRVGSTAHRLNPTRIDLDEVVRSSAWNWCARCIACPPKRCATSPAVRRPSSAIWTRSARRSPT